MIRVLCLCLLATPALADDLLPAPDYFVATAMETSTAQLLAVNCNGLSVNLGAMSRRSEEVLRRLTEDGFTPQALSEEMENPAEAIAVLQDAFVARHDLATEVDEAKICAAGRSEIAEESAIGALLLDLEGE